MDAGRLRAWAGWTGSGRFTASSLIATVSFLVSFDLVRLVDPAGGTRSLWKLHRACG
jgi:hypothetical protein